MIHLIKLITFLSTLALVSAHAAPNDIKVGATLALSGNLAFVGNSQQQGLELAIEDINSNGGINGRNISLIVEDNRGDQKVALDGVNKLIDVDSVDIIFSSFSHITQVIKNKVKNSRKFMVYAASIGDVAKESPLFFRDWGDGDSQGATLAKAVHKAGHSNVLFLTESSEGCQVLQGSFTKTSKDLGLKVIGVEEYSPGETDFKSLLLRIASKKPQSIATCTWRDASIIMPQLKQLGLINIPTFQYFAPFLPASDTSNVRKLFEENKTTAVWLGFTEGNLSDAQKSFFKRVYEKFKSSPRIETALAYDDLMLLAESARACPKENFDSICVAKNMSTKKYNGISGPLTFDENRRSNRPDLLIKVVNGTWQNLN